MELDLENKNLQTLDFSEMLAGPTPRAADDGGSNPSPDQDEVCAAREALHMGVTRIAASNNIISYIGSLQYFHALVEVDLSNNNITTVRGSIWPSSIQRLDLSFNKLRDASFVVQMQCPKMELLNLSGNECLTTLGWKNRRSQQVDDNEDEFPSSSSPQQQIEEELSPIFDTNNSSSASSATLLSLEVLQLSECQNLDSLDGICAARNLVELYVDRCDLSSASSFFGLSSNKLVRLLGSALESSSQEQQHSTVKENEKSSSSSSWQKRRHAALLSSSEESAVTDEDENQKKHNDNNRSSSSSFCFFFPKLEVLEISQNPLADEEVELLKEALSCESVAPLLDLDSEDNFLAVDCHETYEALRQMVMEQQQREEEEQQEAEVNDDQTEETTSEEENLMVAYVQQRMREQQEHQQQQSEQEEEKLVLPSDTSTIHSEQSLTTVEDAEKIIDNVEEKSNSSDDSDNEGSANIEHHQNLLCELDQIRAALVNNNNSSSGEISITVTDEEETQQQQRSTSADSSNIQHGEWTAPPPARVVFDDEEEDNNTCDEVVQVSDSDEDDESQNFNTHQEGRVPTTAATFVHQGPAGTPPLILRQKPVQNSSTSNNFHYVDPTSSSTPSCLSSSNHQTAMRNNDNNNAPFDDKTPQQQQQQQQSSKKSTARNLFVAAATNSSVNDISDISSLSSTSVLVVTPSAPSRHQQAQGQEHNREVAADINASSEQQQQLLRDQVAHFRARRIALEQEKKELMKALTKSRKDSAETARTIIDLKKDKTESTSEIESLKKQVVKSKREVQYALNHQANTTLGDESNNKTNSTAAPASPSPVRRAARGKQQQHTSPFYQSTAAASSCSRQHPHSNFHSPTFVVSPNSNHHHRSHQNTCHLSPQGERAAKIVHSASSQNLQVAAAESERRFRIRENQRTRNLKPDVVLGSLDVKAPGSSPIFQSNEGKKQYEKVLERSTLRDAIRREKLEMQRQQQQTRQSSSSIVASNNNNVFNFSYTSNKTEKPSSSKPRVLSFQVVDPNRKPVVVEASTDRKDVVEVVSSAEVESPSNSSTFKV